MFFFILFWIFIPYILVYLWIKGYHNEKCNRTDPEITIPPQNSTSNERGTILGIQRMNCNDKEQPFTLLNIKGVPNFRGFGGYPSGADGRRHTRRNFLYRSAHPGGMTLLGLQQMKNLGIKFIVNIASHNETTVSWKIPRDIVEEEGFVFLDWPIEKEAFSIKRLLSKYDSYRKDGVDAVSQNYLQLLRNGTEVIRHIFHLLEKNPNDGVLLHCALGKDRTGMVFALLFLLSEVSDAAIAAEYALSTEGLASCVDSIANYLEQETVIHDDMRKKAEEIILARKENMVITINVIRAIYGTAGGYLIKECGFSDEEVQLFRTILLNPIPK